MMKKIITTLLLIAIAPFMAHDAVAQETDEHVRMEYIFCKLNTGFTFDDVIADMKEYGEKVAADGSKYNQFLMRPLIVGDRLDDVTHILAGMWPNGEEMYREYGNYVNKYVDADRENSPHTCEVTVSTMDRVVINDFRENERTDQRWPVQISDCNFKEGVSMDEAVQVQREVHESAVSHGLRGYGVHFQVPYLGFQDTEVDFISTVRWQSFEHRGAMAQNYYKVAADMGEKLNSTASCKNSRAYFVEQVFSTWE